MFTVRKVHKLLQVSGNGLDVHGVT